MALQNCVTSASVPISFNPDNPVVIGDKVSSVTNFEVIIYRELYNIDRTSLLLEGELSRHAEPNI